MTPERWRLMEEIFHSAMECEKEQRNAFLKESCDGDLSLQLEIESLINHSEKAKAEGFLNLPLIKLKDI